MIWDVVLVAATNEAVFDGGELIAELRVIVVAAAAEVAAACSRCLVAAARWLRQRRSNRINILLIRSPRRESLSHSRVNCYSGRLLVDDDEEAGDD